jgi:hypothetical protein
MELIVSVVSIQVFAWTNHRHKKIESSAEAQRVSHHPITLSLRSTTLQQRRAGNCADKHAENGKSITSGAG